MITIHLVPNAHLDPVWMWDWREGMNEGIATCEAVADLLEENPDVTFTRNESIIYEHIERHHPVLFARVRRLIEKGQWEIVGGAMLQPDTNLGGGEAYIRQYIYGQQYFLDRFGVAPEVVYQVDSFGHAAGLPSIYRSVGCRYSIQCRPDNDSRSNLPSRLFRWRGPDGSEILSAHLDYYHVEMFGFLDECNLRSRIKAAVKQTPNGLSDWILLLGMGDHGGGLNRKLIADIRQAMADPPDGCRLEFSTMSRFFSSVKHRWAERPIVDGELGFCFRGCYTSLAPIKRAYANAENLANCAERWSSAAGILVDHNYPAKRLKQVWSDVLFNQFHDILPGTSIERACDEALDHLGRAKHEARQTINDAALSVFSDVNTRLYDGVPVMIFNPHASRFQGPVEVEWMVEYRPIGNKWPERVTKHVRAIGPYGESTPTQFLMEDSRNPVEWRYRSCFNADVPPCGYAVYWMQTSNEELSVECGATAECRENCIYISNDCVCVEYRRDEPGIHVIDRRTDKEWFGGPAAVGLVLEDMQDTWGNAACSWDKVLNKFEITDARIVDSGPIKASFLLTGRCGDSKLVQKFSLYRGCDKVHCEARLLWNEPQCMLKLEFPTRSQIVEAVYETPYAIVKRPVGIGEVPANKWTAVIGDDSSFGVSGIGLHGFDVSRRSMRVSIVRSPPYCYLGQIDAEDLSVRPPTDIGLHRFSYVVAAADEINAAADILHMPVQTTLGYPHSGKLPPSQSVLSISPKEVVLTAMKQAEDGEGWILRLWETAGIAHDVELNVLGHRIGVVSIKPNEVQTVRICKNDNYWEILNETASERFHVERVSEDVVNSITIG